MGDTAKYRILPTLGVGIALWLALTTVLRGQTLEDAWIYFHDKPHAGRYLDHPERMLSARALARRQRLGIAVDSTDVPVYGPYLDSLRGAEGITLLAWSKWLNMAHVQGTEEHIRHLADWSFVDSIRFANRRLGTVARVGPRPDKWSRLQPTAEARVTDEEVPYMMHDAYGLQTEGLTGRGILIAILDAGFPGAQEARVFSHIYARHGVVDTYNFPDDTTGVYTRHWHGSTVWSVIGGYDPDQWTGTAYDADFCLYITEDVYQEMPVEESWWVMGAERADSVGVDVINTSLGYVDFDRADYNHTYDELGRDVAVVSRGASMAVRKGIVVVVSAGNEGLSSWQRISFPADSPEVIAVGAVTADSVRAAFSSTGPDALGRIKPDVMSWGVNVKVFLGDRYYRLSGTSFAAPIITGFTARILQAYPALSPSTYKSFLLQASDRYDHPDNEYGYGIPDFGLLARMLDSASRSLQNVKVYPNPVRHTLYVRDLLVPQPYRLFGMNGRLIRAAITCGAIPMESLAAGVYLLYVGPEGKGRWWKIIKL